MRAKADDKPSDCGWKVYMIRCADGSLYTGITTDIQRRLGEHRSAAGTRSHGDPIDSAGCVGKDTEYGKRPYNGQHGKGAKALRGKGSLQLVFTTSVADRSTALKAEYKIKQLSKHKKEMLVAGASCLEELMDNPDTEQTPQ